MSFGETFLEDPDMFPARLAGESWGEGVLSLDLPAGGYRVRGLSPEQESSLAERYEISDSEADGESVEVQVLRASPREFRRFNLAGWEYSLDFDYGPGTVGMAGLLFMGRLEWKPSFRCGLWTSENGGGSFLELFENFLRVVSAYRLLDSGGVLLHSAGIVSRDRARLFYGRSGAGKSTLSRLSLEAGRSILSDDINVVFQVEGEPKVEAMPFAGDFAQTGVPGIRYPLVGIYRLNKGPKDALEDLTPAAALSSMVACAPFVNRDPHRIDLLTDRLEALIDCVRPQNLQFTLAGGLWEMLEPAP